MVFWFSPSNVRAVSCFPITISTIREHSSFPALNSIFKQMTIVAPFTWKMLYAWFHKLPKHRFRKEKLHLRASASARAPFSPILLSVHSLPFSDSPRIQTFTQRLSDFGVKAWWVRCCIPVTGSMHEYHLSRCCCLFNHKKWIFITAFIQLFSHSQDTILWVLCSTTMHLWALSLLHCLSCFLFIRHSTFTFSFSSSIFFLTF